MTLRKIIVQGAMGLLLAAVLMPRIAAASDGMICWSQQRETLAVSLKIGSGQFKDYFKRNEFLDGTKNFSWLNTISRAVSSDLLKIKGVIASSDVLRSNISADVILICGNDNIKTFEEALALYKEKKIKKIVITGGYGRLTFSLIETALQRKFPIKISKTEVLVYRDRKRLQELKAFDKKGELNKAVDKTESEIIKQIILILAAQGGMSETELAALEKNIYLEKTSQYTKANFRNAIDVLKQIRIDLGRDAEEHLEMVYIQTPHQQFRAKAIFNSLQDEWKNLKVKGTSYTVEFDINSFSRAQTTEMLIEEMWRLFLYAVKGDLTPEYKGKSGIDAIGQDYWEAVLGLIEEGTYKTQLQKLLYEIAVEMKTRKEGGVKKIFEKEEQLRNMLQGRKICPQLDFLISFAYAYDTQNKSRESAYKKIDMKIAGEKQAESSLAQNLIEGAI
ncbi:MAG: hypothetical protein HY810_00860 [Candidatus Omnitrophica bacterium]|nr:hypothetical protein [Candidatus Omnitrophota bacterium]